MKKIIIFLLIAALLVASFLIDKKPAKAAGDAIFIKIGSNPAGATFKVDGKEINDVIDLSPTTKSVAGTSTYSYFALTGNLILGNHTMSLELSGYSKWQKVIDYTGKKSTDNWTATQETHDSGVPYYDDPSLAGSTIDVGIVTLKKDGSATPSGNVILTKEGDTGESQDAIGESIPTLKALVQLYENNAAKITLSWTPPKNLGKDATGNPNIITKYEISRGSPSDLQGNAQANMVVIGDTTSTTFIDKVAGGQTYNYQIGFVLQDGSGSTSNIITITLGNKTIDIKGISVHNVTPEYAGNVDYCPESKLSQPATWFSSSLCGLGIALYQAGQKLMQYAQDQLFAVLGYTKSGNTGY